MRGRMGGMIVDHCSQPLAIVLLDSRGGDWLALILSGLATYAVVWGLFSLTRSPVGRERRLLQISLAITVAVGVVLLGMLLGMWNRR